MQHFTWFGDYNTVTPIPVFDTILIRFAVAMATACGCCFLVPVFATMFITIVTSRDNGYVTCRETLTMDGQWLWVHAEDNKKDIRWGNGMLGSCVFYLEITPRTWISNLKTYSTEWVDNDAAPAKAARHHSRLIRSSRFSSLIFRCIVSFQPLWLHLK